MRALRLEEEELDTSRDESIDSSTTDNKFSSASDTVRMSNCKSESTKRISRSKEDRILDALANAKTVRISNCKSESTHEEQEGNGDSVHESMMDSMMAEGNVSAKIINTIASEESEKCTIYHDSRDSLHEQTMEIIRKEKVERDKVKRNVSRRKIPSATFESSQFTEEDGLMVLKRRSNRSSHHAGNSRGVDWRHTSFNASSA